MDSVILKDVDEVVDALGGTGAVSTLLGIGPSAVSNWRTSGEIPKGWHLQLYLEAERRSIHIDPAVFGIQEPTTGVPA